MISIEEARSLHKLCLDAFGGTHGVRDEGLLIAAIQRPYVTFDGIPLYPSAIDKAAAIVESIVKNHPFIDGNKRMGYILMRLELLRRGYDINASESKKYNFIIDIATGTLHFSKIKEWLLDYTFQL